MDDDYVDEVPFAASFPLPFRVFFLVGLGLLGWAANLHGLELLGIDAVGILDMRTTSHMQTPLPTTNNEHPGFRITFSETAFYARIYRAFAAYSVWCFAAWILFQMFTRGADVLLVDPFRFIPALCGLCLLTILISPFNSIFKRERDLFLHCVQRCIASPIGRPIFFADVIFADVLTSFAKVLGDVWLSVCMFLPGNSLLDVPVISGWQKWILPTIMSLPYAIRLRQCLIEYGLPSNQSRRPLYNALKYASSFPVIYLSAAQRLVVSDLVKEKGATAAHEAWHGEHPVFRLWLLACLVNSLYSFWWDVTNDWGLELLKIRGRSTQSTPKRASFPPRPLVLPALHSRPSSSLTSPGHSPQSSMSSRTRRAYPAGLRPILLYPIPVYPLVVFLNLVLRLTWSIKLSSHLHSRSAEGSLVILWLEIAEIFRRWMWVFIRVEWESLRRNAQGEEIGGAEKPMTTVEFDAGEDESYEMLSSQESFGGGGGAR